jgi:hypothetical protein
MGVLSPPEPSEVRPHTAIHLHMYTHHINNTLHMLSFTHSSHMALIGAALRTFCEPLRNYDEEAEAPGPRDSQITDNIQCWACRSTVETDRDTLVLAWCWW